MLADCALHACFLCVSLSASRSGACTVPPVAPYTSCVGVRFICVTWSACSVLGSCQFWRATQPTHSPKEIRELQLCVNTHKYRNIRLLWPNVTILETSSRVLGGAVLACENQYLLTWISPLCRAPVNICPTEYKEQPSWPND